jgi:HEPN domain-containing protein
LTSRDHARVLLGKARDDAVAVRKLAGDAEIADAVVGFHAQQAVEKALKAVLSAHDRAYPWTHDLRHLMELLDAAGSPLPAELSDARRLTPWAAEFRYGETIDEGLDRPGTMRIVEAVLRWAESQSKRAAHDPPPG